MGPTFPEIAAKVAYSGRIVLDETPRAMAGAPPERPSRAGRRRDLQTNTGECYLVRDRATPDGGRVMVFTDVTDKCPRRNRAGRADQRPGRQPHAKADKQKSAISPT